MSLRVAGVTALRIRPSEHRVWILGQPGGQWLHSNRNSKRSNGFYRLSCYHVIGLGLGLQNTGFHSHRNIWNVGIFILILQMLKLRLRISGEPKDHIHPLGKEEDIENQ